MTSIKFVYHSRTYCALVRTVASGNQLHHHITVMNGELEKLLYGHHIFIESAGIFIPGIPPSHPEAQQLKQCIMDAYRKQWEMQNKYIGSGVSQ